MAALAWRREAHLFDADMRHDDRVLARSLARSAEHEWKIEGEHAAIDVVEHTEDPEGAVRLRWVSLDAPPGSKRAPAQPGDKLEALS